MASTNRRQARDRALALLYEADMKGISTADVVAGLAMEPVQYTSDVVLGVAEHQAEIDEVITRHSRGWTIERMPALDRALLRMGVFELLFRADVPSGVVISEAVELAGQYSTDESSRFVNGMLSGISQVVRATAAPGA